MSYTLLALAGLAFALLLDLVVLRTRLIRRRAFWVAYAIIIVFQLISNGVLTYRHIVRYDSGTILGLRIAGAPVEDLVFGFSLVLQTLAWWIWWGRRLGSRVEHAEMAAERQPKPPFLRARRQGEGMGRGDGEDYRARVALQSAGPATASRRGSVTLTRRSRTW